MHQKNNRQYKRTDNKRIDIQAMRFLAVSAVFLYHLWPNNKLFIGGYIGVDIFFVISGYLMTTTILKLLNGEFNKVNDQFSLNKKHSVNNLFTKIKLFFGHFYYKRIKRLLPASYFALIFILFTCIVFFRNSYDFILNGFKGVIFSTVFMQNWHLANTSVDYSQLGANSTIVEHYWSLSLEEQFYFIWPLFLLIFFLISLIIFRRKFLKRILFISIFIFTAISFVYLLHISATDPAQSYFITWGRVWELSFGGLIALIPTFKQNKFITELLPFSGLFICLFGIHYLNSSKILFPSVWTLIPIIGTSLVLLNNDRSIFFKKISSVKIIQWIGDISYSLYLYHFIVIVLYKQFSDKYSFFRARGQLSSSLIVLFIAFFLAAFSYYFIEKTTAKIVKARFLVIPLIIALISILFVSNTVINAGNKNSKDNLSSLNALVDEVIKYDINYNKNEQQKNKYFNPKYCIGAIAIEHPNKCKKVFSNLIPEGKNINPNQDTDIAIKKKCFNNIDNSKCVFGEKNSKNSVLLLGDSHAKQLSNGLDIALKQLGLRLGLGVYNYCPPTITKKSDLDKFLSNDTRIGSFLATKLNKCLAFNKSVENSIAFKNAKALIFSTTFFTIGNIELQKRIINNLNNLAAQTGKKIIIVSDDPYVDGPNLISKNIYSVKLSSATSKMDTFSKLVNNQKNHFKYLNLKNLFCDTKKCYSAIGGIQPFRINFHISGNYSKTMYWFFEKELKHLL